MITTSTGHNLTPDSSRSSSDMNMFENVDAVGEEEEEGDRNGRTSESMDVTNTKKVAVTIKKAKEGVWKSHFHCVVTLVMVNYIHYWIPPWYDKTQGSQGLLAIHFILLLLFIHLPITYMEMLLALYTKQPPINLWKICPIFIGYGYALIAYSFLQSWFDTVYCGRNLLYLVESVFDQAPWLRCAPQLGKKCLVLTDKTKLSMDCRLDENTTSIWCPDQGAFEFSTQHWFKSRYIIDPGNVRLDVQWRIVLCSIVHWFIVTLSVMRTIYKFSTMIYLLGIFVLIFTLVDFLYVVYHMSLTALVRIAFRPPHPSDFINEEYWAIAYISTIWRSHVTLPPLTMTFVARIDSKFNVAWSAVTITFVSFLLMLMKTTSRSALLHLIAKRLNIDHRLLAANNGSTAMALMPMHLGTLPMPLMWTFYWFAMQYVLLWLQSTVVAEAILENLFLKNNVRKEFRIYFVGLYCVTGCIVDVVIIIKSALGSMYLLFSRIIFDGTSLMPLVESTFVFIIYGLGVFIDDMHFTFGSPPSFFWRFCWRILPFTLLTLYLTTIIANLNKKFPPLETPLWILKGTLSAIIPVFALKQIVYAVYNDNLTYLFNPIFDWGPPEKETRKARKRFNPKTDIRSQPERTIDYVKPRNSVHDLNIE